MQVQNYGHQSDPQEFPDNRKGPIIGELDKALAHRGDDKDYLRKLVLGWLTLAENETMGPVSSKLLTPQQWNGIWMWIGSEQMEDNNWYPRSAFPVECNWVCTRAMYDYNKFLEASKAGHPYSARMSVLLANIPDLPDIPEHSVEINPEEIIQQTMHSMPGIMPIGDSLRGITTAAEASNRVMHRLQSKEKGELYDEPENIEPREEPITNPEPETEEPDFGY
jgi:hypothetical protein